jgi:hypothetical protein
MLVGVGVHALEKNNKGPAERAGAKIDNVIDSAGKGAR